MEMNLLYAIQNWHTPILDKLMVTVFNTIVGEKGQLWAIIGILLLFFKKTRKCGICVLAPYALAFAVGDFILKDLIARPRPCKVDDSVALLIKRPESFSCPSVHTALAFAATASVFLRNRKAGIPALIFAALVGFSRLYFFVHYPSDVLFGAVLGVGVAIGVYALYNAIFGKKKEKKA